MRSPPIRRHFAALALFASAAILALPAVSFAQEGPPRTPTVPNGLVVSSTSAGVQLSWRPDDNKTYDVYRQEAGEGAFRIARGITADRYLDDSAIDGMRYKYSINGCNRVPSCSFLTSSISITAMLADNGGGGGDMCPPTTSGEQIPTQVELFEDEGDIILGWLPPEGSGKQNVYRNDAYVTTIDNGIPRYVVPNYTPGDTFYVTAIFGDPNGGPSTFSRRSVKVSTITPPEGEAGQPSDCALIAEDNVELEGVILGLESDIVALRAENDALKDNPGNVGEVLAERDIALLEVERLGEQVAILTTERDEARAERDTAVADLGAAESARADAEAALAPAEADRDAALARVTDLEAQLEACEAERVAATADFEAALVTIGDQTDIIADLSADLAACPGGTDAGSDTSGGDDGTTGGTTDGETDGTTGGGTTDGETDGGGADGGADGTTGGGTTDGATDGETDGGTTDGDDLPPPPPPAD